MKHTYTKRCLKCTNKETWIFIRDVLKYHTQKGRDKEAVNRAKEAEGAR